MPPIHWSVVLRPLRVLPTLVLLTPLINLAGQIRLSVDTGAPAREISPDLMGVFFEDLNYAADGGLYAELIQNRSFEYTALDRRDWTNLSAWELQPRGGKGALDVDAAFPLHANNPHYAVLTIADAGEVAVSNAGFDGIVVRAGETYDVGLFVRRLYAGGRWDGNNSTAALPLLARLETKDGAVLAEAAFEIAAGEWTWFSATFVPSASADDARFVLVGRERGAMALDEVSVFPRKTFRERKNGLRADLAQAIADLKPRFMRFPGGCLVHGNGIPNFYRWKDTIGPVEQRRQQANLWGYHQTVGLGYFEYFQFCEDIGAKPLPVVPAAVSCQNSGHTGGTGQQCVPMEDMPAYIQDVLDLIEWANGPATSTWGAKRAAAGHPEPFGLRYVGVGNEDRITPGFEERFRMIFEAVRAAHPEITVIGTVGPSPAGEDFEKGWKLADELRVPMVDEHYYQSPQWFWENLTRYDGYDRGKSKVYLGEYAAHDRGRRSTLRSALAEAAHLTSLERNGDVVALASYAPLLAKRDRTQWRPDLIYFTNTAVFPTINYQVQRLFGHNAGDQWLETAITTEGDTEAPKDMAVSTVLDSVSGDLILKIVNAAGKARPLRVRLAGLKRAVSGVRLTVLAAGSADAVSDFDHPDAVMPVESELPAATDFDHVAPANSLSVLRVSVAR